MLSVIPGCKLEKRPLLRRQQSASSKSRLIYVSTSTPFMSIVKRVRKELDKSTKGRLSATKDMSLGAKVDALKKGDGTSGDRREILVLGTGRAIEKTVSVATWFTRQNDCLVTIKTRTMGTVDDVMVPDEAHAEDETRIRNLSCLEVSITLK
jgi:ribonuclease P/MRP protein subunit POP7